jgi:hypothetical protein
LSDVYDTRTWSLLNIILFGILIIIPYNRILSIDSLDIDESSLHNQKYDDAYVNFYIDYERANPMTKKEGYIKYQKTLRDRGYIKNDEYEKFIFDVNNINPMNMFFNRRGGGGYSSQNNGFFGQPLNNFAWNNFAPPGPFGFYAPQANNFNNPPLSQNFDKSSTTQQNIPNMKLVIKSNNVYNSENQNLPSNDSTFLNFNHPSQGFSGGFVNVNNNFNPPSSQAYSGGSVYPNNIFNPQYSQGFSGSNMGPNNNCVPPSSQGYSGGSIGPNNIIIHQSSQGYSRNNIGGPGQFQKPYQNSLI